jgi:hypothetical protein
MRAFSATGRLPASGKRERNQKRGGGEVKQAIKLWDLLMPPFKTAGALPHIFDGNDFVCGMVRGWGSLQDYENGAELQDELKQFIVDAMNEKFEREKPHTPDEPVDCITCKGIEEMEDCEPGHYRCAFRGVDGVDPYAKDPCSFYERDGG